MCSDGEAVCFKVTHHNSMTVNRFWLDLSFYRGKTLDNDHGLQRSSKRPGGETLDASTILTLGNHPSRHQPQFFTSVLPR